MHSRYLAVFFLNTQKRVHSRYKALLLACCDQYRVTIDRNISGVYNTGPKTRKTYPHDFVLLFGNIYLFLLYQYT